MFLIPESPVAFVTHWGKCWFNGNDDVSWNDVEALRKMLIWWQWDSVFNSWVLCDLLHICEENVDFMAVAWVSCYLCDAVDVEMRHWGKCWFDGNETLFLFLSLLLFVMLFHMMLKWGIEENVDLMAMRLCFYSWVSCCLCDAVAHDVEMRHWGKCWFDGNETVFLIPESPVAFVTLFHMMLKWGIKENVDLMAMRLCF